MSLDVYLYNKDEVVYHPVQKIYIRENGEVKEISLEEWKELFPNTEPVTAEIMESSDRLYHANITHNLGVMASAADLYISLWRPEELGIEKAKELIEPLRNGLNKLKMNPEKYEAMNPSNGWGSYDGLVKFVEKYLEACEEYPDALVEVSR